jgi:hypothetical protein
MFEVGDDSSDDDNWDDSRFSSTTSKLDLSNKNLSYKNALISKFWSRRARSTSDLGG